MATDQWGFPEGGYPSASKPQRAGSAWGTIMLAPGETSERVSGQFAKGRAYQAFRTGLTFGDVREILAQEQRRAREKGLYMFVSRSTVLGRWREIKEAEFFGYDPPEHEPLAQWEFPTDV